MALRNSATSHYLKYDDVVAFDKTLAYPPSVQIPPVSAHNTLPRGNITELCDVALFGAEEASTWSHMAGVAILDPCYSTHQDTRIKATKVGVVVGATPTY
ncbi:hypothetical protein GCM10008018_60450 [Paenibacillus marchantiophytorum]|uniref:Uncharacterized protein n=1 Tax=Paenibacillus marchantiophytorum TaxID=1619310 RepID=A0ABQ1FDN1_9BACL|nr:hypothetical protein [Paenibacillus marchantiophytorum]GGA06494.1 hypothetical protein GCM10008018_60450 [Paenibacillus marchantiophytorum]